MPFGCAAIKPLKDAIVNYFIMGNNYLSHFQISIMNDSGSYFEVGSGNQKDSFTSSKIKDITLVTKQNPFFEKEVMDSSKINADLSVEQQSQLIQLLTKHKTAFTTIDEPFGAIKGHQLKITLSIERPYPPALRKSPYPASPRSRETLAEHINGLLQLKVILKVGANENVDITTPVIIAWHDNRSRLVGDF
jgi:hypothetical protein